MNLGFRFVYLVCEGKGRITDLTNYLSMKIHHVAGKGAGRGRHRLTAAPNFNSRHWVAVAEAVAVAEDRLEEVAGSNFEHRQMGIAVAEDRLEDRPEDRLEEIFQIIRVRVVVEVSVNLRVLVIGSDKYVNPLKGLPNVDSGTGLPDCSVG